MDVDATRKQAKSVQRKISAIPHVARTEYVSKAEGLRNLRQEIGDEEISQGITQLRDNPLPILIIVRPDDPNNLDSIQAAITPPGRSGKPEPISPAIDKVERRSGRGERHSHGDQRREDRPFGDRGPAPGRVADARREHDPALDLCPSPRDRGDEARRRDQLVHPLAIRARGPDRRPVRRRARGGDPLGWEGRHNRPAGRELRPHR